MEVTFPNGIVVRAVGIEKRDVNACWRSFGLYLDEWWSPTWTATVISWPDFGLPEDSVETAAAILGAYRRAVSGEHVEIGCIGGLGRTGTVLACMAVLAGVADDEAVGWVQDQYDPRAIETGEQVEWVRWFAKNITGDNEGSGE